MSVLAEVLESAQPAYEPAVRRSILLIRDTFGETAFAGCGRASFVDRVTELLAERPLPAGLRLQLISDLTSLSWWCELGLSDAATGALAAAARRTYYEQAQALPRGPLKPDPAALTAHAVFVGSLISELHSPTRGAFEYVRALAADPDTRLVEVFHSGPLKPELKAFGEARLGAGAARTTFIQIDDSFLARATKHGPRTFHFWCEQAYAVRVSLMSLFGPTLMFTCGDAAPVQHADVYWYCQDADYIQALWARKGAPPLFIGNYRTLESAPFNRPQPLRRRSRAELGFREDETVIVTAGNRLGVEMDQPFVDGMGALMVADPKLRWVLVGGLQDFWIDAFRQVLGGRFTHVPFDADLASLFAVCDLFANPFRAGGGNTAIMAIDAGAVAVTRGDIGDVGAFVPPAHAAPSAEAYFARLAELIADPALRAAWSVQQQAMLARRLDQDHFAAELKQLTKLAYQRFVARTPAPLELLLGEAPPMLRSGQPAPPR